MQCGHRHCACANSTTLLGLPLCMSRFTTSPLRMQKHSGAAHRGPVGSRLPGGCMGGPSAGGAVDGERLPRGLLGGRARCGSPRGVGLAHGRPWAWVPDPMQQISFFRSSRCNIGIDGATFGILGCAVSRRVACRSSTQSVGAGNSNAMGFVVPWLLVL